MSGLKIIITDPAPTVSAKMESTFAPCAGCLFYGPARDGDETSTCGRANAALSAKVLATCEQSGWFTKAGCE